jgi:hypothetical protein
LNNIRNVTELLSDMVYALNPSDQEVEFVGLKPSHKLIGNFVLGQAD